MEIERDANVIDVFEQLMTYHHIHKRRLLGSFLINERAKAQKLSALCLDRNRHYIIIRDKPETDYYLYLQDVIISSLQRWQNYV